MSYSDKVQSVFAPRGTQHAFSGRFILLAPLPTETAWSGRRYRFQVETDNVSKEQRLFAKDIELEKAGQYSAYLMATAGTRADLDGRMYTTGILSESRPGNGLFGQLVKDGRAKRVS